jgi:hypothetical protein
LGGQARLALRRAHRIDARELNLDRDDAARPAALSRPRRAQAAWDLARAAVEDRDRAVSLPGSEGDAGVGGEVLPTGGVLVDAESEHRPGELGVDWGDMRLASRPHRRHRDQPDAPPELDELGRGHLAGGVGDRVGDRWRRGAHAPVEQRLEGQEFCRGRV